MIGKLISPLSYLRINNSSIRIYSFLFPGILCIIFLIIYYFFPTKINIFYSGGLLDLTFNYLSILVGFYIASLAAIATFQNNNLDKKIQGEPAILTRVIRGKKIEDELTRRKFLCLLFGYCSFISIILIIISIFSRIFLFNLIDIIPVNYQQSVRMSFLFIYMFMFFNLIITTFLGLNYLTTRMHRP